jgi:hypothetical protein
MIATIWTGMRDAGLPEVMLYLPDGSASRCHWDDTALIGTERVALLADQERGIVRIVALSACAGIGIASPKGTDPSGFRSVVRGRLDKAYPQTPPAATPEG